jgi:tetratricopeptide (TPR) repeat protein
MARLDVLEKLVARGPNDPFPYYGLAQEYRSQGRHDDALRAFGDLRGRFPGYVPQYLMAAQMLQELGRTAEARGWCEAGIEVARTARDGHSLGELESFLGSLGP